MQVDIFSSSKKIKLEAGDLIIAQLNKNTIVYYLLIKEYEKGVSPNYKLLNVELSSVMASFSSKIPAHAINYIQEALKSEILDVIPANKLKVELK